MKKIAKEIIKVDIEKELKTSYLDYAMSVIISRALPDVRDGLKPVHRRILFAMYVLGNLWNKPYKKSARIVGDVIGKYHPHGDSAVYDTIVRMAQPFSLRYVLIDGQGNFGSVDGDSAAAMRYTEIRMSKISQELLKDLDKKTVNFVSNYDSTEYIPEILPTTIPNLLINGSSGIAVGMATNIPPHNLNEVIDACLAVIKNKKISLSEIMQYLPGPDFPTYGIIHGTSGIRKAYETGKGKICIRARSKIQISKKSKKEKIIIHEIPYQVNKARLIEKIAELVKEKKIEGITALRDESDKDGMRIVIEIKRESRAKIVLNQLYLLTQLQISFGINMVALYKKQPKTLSLLDILNAFINHRKEVVYRKNLFKLKKYFKKSNILEGISIALHNIDEIILLIQSSSNPKSAKKILLSKKWEIKNLLIKKIIEEKKQLLYKWKNKNKNINIKFFSFSEEQTKSILDLKLQKITSLEQKKILEDHSLLLKKIKNIIKILKNTNYITEIIKEDLYNIKKKFGDTRKTEICKNPSDINIEDVITKTDVVVTLSHSGYVKYQPLSDYEAQKRGGKGKSAVKTKEEDFIESLLVANTHDTILCFSSRGVIYWLKVYQLPEASRNARGRPIINLLPLNSKERITTILSLNEYKDNINIFMATLKGMVKKTSSSLFKRPRSTGIIAINLKDNDELIGVSLTNGNDTVMLFTSLGKVVHFSEKSVRKMGRNASGVRGIKIKQKDKVVSLIIPENNKGNILTVTENGFGKQTQTSDFPIKSRPTQGVIAIKTTKKNGVLIGAIQVFKNNQIMMITNAGTLVRTRISEIGILKRNTQGVILIRTIKNEKVVAVQKLNSLY